MHKHEKTFARYQQYKNEKKKNIFLWGDVEIYRVNAV